MVSPIGRVEVGGVAGRDECRISATLAEVMCVLSDGVQSIGPARMHAYLADSDRVPALLGMSGLLEQSVLHVDIPNNQAMIQPR